MKNNQVISHRHKFELKDNQIIVNDLTLTNIENLVGNTTFYVYDKKQIFAVVAKLKKALPQKIKLHYAIKANPLPSLLHYMSNLVSGFDVASKKEMLLAIQTGIPEKDISFAGPGKSDQDLQSAIIAKVTLHIESLTEFKRVQYFAKQLNIKPNIAFRINPKFELKSSGMKMSGGSKPFGIDEELMEDILTNIN